MGSWGFLIVETFSAIWMADVEPEGRFLQKPQARKERVAFQGSGDALDWLGCRYPARVIYYWSSGNTAKVDFIIQSGAKIVPIEVKSEKNAKARSLAEYRKKYEPKYSVKTSMRHDTAGEEVLNIPLYLISRMAGFSKF